MKVNRTIAAAAAALTLSAVPALALASQPTNPGQGHGPPAGVPYGQQGTTGDHGTTGDQGTTGGQGPGPGANLPAKAKAYGRYCQGESKKHVAGTPGTPFSKCVTDMAKLANGSAKNPTSACKNESKKHVKGEKGTPYSRCVSGAAKLLKSQS
jgi:hypothetical protein